MQRIKMNHLLWLVTLCFTLPVIQGCGSSTTPEAQKNNEVKKPYVDPGPAPGGQKEPDQESPPKTSQSTPAETETDPVSLTTVSWDELQAEVKKHSGKVVVLDLWAFTCLPCKKEFPHFVELQKLYPDKVVCISVNCDYMGLEDKNVDSYKPNALKFLKEKKAVLKNVIVNVPQPDLFGKISLTSLPAVYVYKKDGSLAKRFDFDLPEFATNGFNYHDHINPLVNKILAE